MTLFGFQIVYLALRTQVPAFQTFASVAADVLTAAATLVLISLSFLYHQRAFRPSKALSLYLSASVLLGIARLRTAWLISSSGSLPIVFTIIFILTLAVFLLESLDSKHIHHPHGEFRTLEQRSGFWGQVFFLWLMKTFYLGYSKVISLQDLPPLDPNFESRKLHRDLIQSWKKCKLLYFEAFGSEDN